MKSSHSDFDGLSIWGLSSEDLHAAWWRGLGIQVVHYGSTFSNCRGAELYLLIPAARLVAFDIGDIVERVIWSRSSRIRLGVLERNNERYREEIVRDVDGSVRGLSRSYATGSSELLTAIISTDSEDAAIWAAGGCAATELLDSIPETDSEKVLGHVFNPDRAEEEERFISRLVAVWTDPDRVITGIVETENGVFKAKDSVDPELTLVPPVWVGNVESGMRVDHRVFAGPDFLPDHVSASSSVTPATIREIRDIGVGGGRQSKRLLPRRTFYGLFKRSYDALVAGLALLMLSPLLLLTCIMVVIDDGFPIFFGHERQARGGRNFKCWKFRTMRRNAESMVAELEALNKADGPQVFIENDPRVTRIGRVLRNTQIDELPQLWNVIRGDMSFVGPRPSPERENQFCPAWREIRLSVRPGITGLWQLRRTRNPGEDFQEWIKYDVEYVRSASTLLDVKVIFFTACKIIGRR